MTNVQYTLNTCGQQLLVCCLVAVADVGIPPSPSLSLCCCAADEMQVPYDGLWIDMNEPTNFCSGEVCRLHPDSTLHALFEKMKELVTGSVSLGE